MTLLDEPLTASPANSPASPKQRSLGAVVISWVTSTDHKVIGYMYLITSFVFFLIAGLMAMVIRACSSSPTSSTTRCSRCTAR